MKAAVVGGGPAGCAAAYTLRKQGHQVVLFEAQDHVGGRTSQVLKEGFSLGSGALFLMGGIYPRTNAILKELGRFDELVKWDALSVPPKGAGQVSEWLVEGTPGLDLRLSTPVDKIARADTGYTVTAGGERHRVDAVIVAPEPGVAADLLADLVEPETTKTLRDCLYSDYAHVQVCYRRNPWPKHRASVALPANMDRDWGACVLLSKRQPAGVPPGGEAVGVYFYTPPLERMSDDDIVKSALNAVLEVYGPAPEPDFVELFHYRRGLSIANPGHYGRLNSLHAQMPAGIHLAGDYFAHAGIEAAIVSGELAANRLAETHRPGPQKAVTP